MSKEKEATQRGVYVLPTELVERIVAFQSEKGYPSEVEAARKLLDEALKSRDDEYRIIRRFQERLQNLRMPAEVAKDVLVGPPFILDISFDNDHVDFTVKGRGKYRIKQTEMCSNSAMVLSDGRNGHHFKYEPDK
ncbi:hypothetical protein G3A39_40135 [Paraburkholderia aspalathi]|nr:hypothetical protein [Paraburkholderia aspalathi]